MAVGGVWIGGLFWIQRAGEDPLSQRRCFPFAEQNRCTGGQHDFSSACAGLGIAGGQAAAIFPVDGAADFQCTVDLIEILPPESAEFTPPQAGGQFGVEEVVPDFVLCDDSHEHFQLLFRQNLFRTIGELWDCDLLSGVAGNQMSLLCRLQGFVEHTVDTINGSP